MSSFLHRPSSECPFCRYWESLLKRIAVTKAKAVLNDIHKEMLERNGSYSNVHQEDFIGALSTAPVPEKASVVTDEEKQMVA